MCTSVRFIARLCLVALLPLLGGCVWITRANVSVNGGEVHQDGGVDAISADGRYLAFTYMGDDLFPGDHNGHQDVFVRDLRTGVTRRVSVAMNGGDSNADSSNAAISGDGRFVAFVSDASNLVPDDGNGMMDVFVRDMQLGVTRRVNVDLNGNDADLGGTNGPGVAISSDGRFIAFTSPATDLVPGTDANDKIDVFVRDMQQGVTSRVSVNTDGGDPDGQSGGPAISDDGRYVAFWSLASDLVGDDHNGSADVFIRDLDAGTTTRVSVDPNGQDADSGSFQASVSSDGRYVAFCSDATDLVPGDQSGPNHFDEFVRDLQTPHTTAVSVDLHGVPAGGCNGTISGDGRYVAFDSGANNLVPDDTNAQGDVFVRDLWNATTRLVSTNGLEVPANAETFGPLISRDGRYVAFNSIATNLVPNDHNGGQDLFVRAALIPTVTSVTPSALAPGVTETLRIVGDGFLADTAVSIIARAGNGGVSVASVHVVSDTELDVSVHVAADATPGPRDFLVWAPGTGPGSAATGIGGCTACLTVT